MTKETEMFQEGGVGLAELVMSDLKTSIAVLLSSASLVFQSLLFGLWNLQLAFPVQVSKWRGGGGGS